jgi:germination protein M
MKKIFISLLLVLTMFIMLPACNPFDKMSSSDEFNDETLPVSSIAIGMDDANNLNNKLPLHLYFGSKDSNGLGMEIRYIPFKDAGNDTESMATCIVKEILKGPQDKNRVSKIIPENTKLIENVKVKRGTAYINLSKDFIDKQPEDKIKIRLSIYSIVDSVTELNDVSRIVFTFNGETVKSINKSFRMDKPFPRDEALLPKSIQKATKSSASDEKQDDIILQPYE